MQDLKKEVPQARCLLNEVPKGWQNLEAFKGRSVVQDEDEAFFMADNPTLAIQPRTSDAFRVASVVCDTPIVFFERRSKNHWPNTRVMAARIAQCLEDAQLKNASYARLKLIYDYCEQSEPVTEQFIEEETGLISIIKDHRPEEEDEELKAPSRPIKS